MDSNRDTCGGLALHVNQSTFDNLFGIERDRGFLALGVGLERATVEAVARRDRHDAQPRQPRGRDGRDLDPESPIDAGTGHPGQLETLEARRPIADLLAALGNDGHPGTGDRLVFLIDYAAGDDSTRLGRSLDLRSRHGGLLAHRGRRRNPGAEAHDRQREDQDHQRDQAQHDRRSGQAAPGTARVEDRQQSPFQMRRPRHRQGGQRMTMPRSERPGQVEQMRGVIGCAGAREQDDVIAGALALDAHPTRREPGEWVEPVDGTRQLGDGLGQAVEPLDVGQLVEEDVAPAARRPILRAFGKQDDRPDANPRSSASAHDDLGAASRAATIRAVR